MTDTCYEIKNYTSELKAEDIIDVDLYLEFIDFEDEEETVNISSADDYNRRYSVYYMLNGKIKGYDNFTVEKGYCLDIENISCFINEDLQQSFPEIKEYEIFDIKQDIFGTQNAKVRIISLH